MGSTEDLKVRLEELGLDSNQVEEAIASYNKAIIEPTPTGDNIFFQLWQEAQKAETWQDKARIQAKIISERIDI